MPATVVPDSFARYKDKSSKYIRQMYKNHTNVSLFSTHYRNILERWSIQKDRASTVNYVGHFKSKASSFIPFLDTAMVSHTL